MAKVKKRAALTGVRNARAAKAKVRSAGPRARKVVAKATRKAGAKGGPKKVKARKGRPVVPEPVARMAVRELDPQRKCGTGTSVQFLYRVDETVDGRATAHLVFFDRHGWYCEHGRTCPAVAHARKHNGRIARVS